MTQPFYQEQQSNQQGANQQMLLCPVRLVYETQILVQPGEQIQPNQTIFINPQNPPPWIQNRPQNQVLYVQQIAPNNYIPQVQQQAGQNQLYMHQNFSNVQQIMPQQIVSQTQHKEVRSANVQMTNVLQRTTVQGQTLQAHPGPYNPNVTNEPPIAAQTPNFGILPPNYSNVPSQIGQNQINFIPANVNKQVLSNVQAPPRPSTTNIVNLPGTTEMHQNVYRPMHQQTFQHENNMPPISLPQSITMVPIQSASTYQNAGNDNNVEHNVAQIRPVQLQTPNAPRLPQPSINTVSSYTNERIVRKVATVPPKGVNNPVNHLVNTGPKNVPTYSYRPIQPRPQQQRNMAPSLVPLNTQIMPPIQSSNVTNVKPQNYPTASNYVKTEPNIVIRKRKSESPDEVQNKMIFTNITQKNKIIPPVQTTNTYNSIGVNTVPIQKTNNKTLKTILNNPNIVVNQINEERKDIVPRLENPTEKESVQISETEKLLRNTVFTQARNRVLADKQEVISTNIVKVETKPSDIKIEQVPEKDTSKELNKEIIKEDETIKEAIKEAVVNTSNVVEKAEKDCKEPNTSADTTKPVKIEESIKNIDCIENLKEINLLGNSKSNDQNGFVLTHVLDGYVIQESNVAFPIRRPLKEKTLQPNVAKTEVKMEESKNTKNETNDKIFNLSFLQLNEADDQKKLTGDNESEDSKDNPDMKENPFEELKTQVVKTWTVEQLTTHLSRYQWDETVSVLREHEIDGESLFLVSKNQLMTIGVNEEHAGVICDFVKN